MRLAAGLADERPGSTRLVHIRRARHTKHVHGFGGQTRRISKGENGPRLEPGLDLRLKGAFQSPFGQTVDAATSPIQTPGFINDDRDATFLGGEPLDIGFDKGDGSWRGHKKSLVVSVSPQDVARLTRNDQIAVFQRKVLV